MTDRRTLVRVFSAGALLVVIATGCGGGSGSSGSNPAVAPAPLSVGPTQGLVSGGLGLSSGEGVDSVAVVGVSGTGLVVGVSGTGLSYGTIQNFGSIVINDRIIDTDLAVFEIKGVRGTQEELSQGQQVAIVGDLDRDSADQVIYQPNLLGPVQSVSNVDPVLSLGRMQIMGQQVRINAATVFEGTRLEQLSVGQTLEVSGIVDEQGVVTATYIGSADAPERFLLLGQVDQVTADSFVIHGQSVRYDPGRLIGFEDNQLSQGDVVLVRVEAGTYDPAAAEVVALEVEQMPRLVVAGDATLSVEGIIDSTGPDELFTVQGQPIEVTAQTRVVNGSLDELGIGVRVSLEGQAGVDGVIIASEIYIESDDTVKLQGPLDAVDLDLGTLTVFGLETIVRPGTELEGIASIDELTIGQVVELSGYIDGPSVILGEIEVEAGSEQEIEVRGPARQIDGPQMTLTILGIAVRWDSQTQFEDFDDATISEQAFFELLQEGVFVSAEWEGSTDLTDPVDSLSLEDD